jgi:thiol:disulfide interchange protein DsbD
LLRALGLALAGGVVLNVMPCVLPVLSVKALALVSLGGGSRAVMRAHGLAYTAGVLVAFAIVAGGLLAVRAGGERVGWGFQLQSPLFVTLLAYLLFVMGLTLSGVVIPGSRLAGSGVTWHRGAGTPVRSSPARSPRWPPPRARPPSWERRSATR